MPCLQKVNTRLSINYEGLNRLFPWYPILLCSAPSTFQTGPLPPNKLGLLKLSRHYTSLFLWQSGAKHYIHSPHCKRKAESAHYQADPSHAQRLKRKSKNFTLKLTVSRSWESCANFGSGVTPMPLPGPCARTRCMTRGAAPLLRFPWCQCIAASILALEDGSSASNHSTLKSIA